MSFITHFVQSIFGKPAGQVSSAAADSVQSQEDQAKAARTALLETEGGAAGMDLQAGQVESNRNTILGN